MWVMLAEELAATPVAPDTLVVNQWVALLTALFLAVPAAAGMAIQIWNRIDAQRRERAAKLEREAVAAAARKGLEDAAKAADRAATEARDVKSTLASVTTKTSDDLDAVRAVLAESKERQEGMAKVAAATHTLVNNNMGIQLALVAAALQRIAVLEPTAENTREAQAAKHAYEDHMAKQATVDAVKAADKP